jgi:glycosyltransferase involved in cell wall biosynthesis
MGARALPIKVLHIATGLKMGGAETSLANLMAFTDRAEFEPRVLALSDDQPVGDRIRALGVPVDTLGMRAGRIVPTDFVRLTRYLRQAKPDLIQTWMYHADLLGSLAAPLAGDPPVVWGLHLTVNDMQSVKRGTRLVIRLNALLSHWSPARIVCCAENTLRSHADIGYAAAKMLVIPNGFDLAKFQPDDSARVSVRAELGLWPETKLVGMAARFHPQKDHANFVAAANHLHEKMPDTHFVLWGKDVNWENADLAGWIDTVRLRDQTHLLDLRLDAPRLTAALDVAALSSARGEAFPMVIGEAMACAVPCAVTDVGDAKSMVAETGRTVPPGDAAALAHAWQELLSMPDEERSRLGRRARQRVMDLYDIRKTSGQYAQLYKDIITKVYR